MTSKQRAKLRGLAAGADAAFQVGKEGVTDAQLDGMSQALNKRELIKVTVLKTCAEQPADLLIRLGQSLGAEPVATIGRKIILYRRSKDPNARHIEL